MNSLVLVYPNPTKGSFNIRCENATLQQSRIIVLTPEGTPLQTIEKADLAKSVEIDLENYPKGNYFLKILAGKNVVMKKVIVN